MRAEARGVLLDAGSLGWDWTFTWLVGWARRFQNVMYVGFFLFAVDIWAVRLDEPRWDAMRLWSAGEGFEGREVRRNGRGEAEDADIVKGRVLMGYEGEESGGFLW